MNSEISIWEMGGKAGEKELTRNARLLELIARKNAVSLLAGNYHTAITGQGLNFKEARKYVFGDPVRQIDWSITARMNEPYVRLYHEEREREIIFALDISPTMHTGWQDRRKIEYAAEITASLCCASVMAGDRTGLITYSDRVKDFIRPAGGDSSLFSVIRTVYNRTVSEPSPASESDLRQAVHTVQKMKGKRFMIFFLSDFIDYDFPDDIRYLKKTHDVTMIHIYDPFEYCSSPDISFCAFSPEGKKTVSLFSPSSAEELPEKCSCLAAASAKYDIPVITVSTADPVRHSLARLLRMNRRR